MILFPFVDYWWFYIGFTFFILVILALDLGVFHKKAQAISFQEALKWTVFWTALALIFNYFLYHFALWKFSTQEQYSVLENFNAATQAKTVGIEFFTGFMIEKSLAIDNIFIFSVVFSSFGIPKEYQYRVLFWGILGAFVFRAIFIGLGSQLMQHEGFVIFMGGVLIFTGIKMAVTGTKQKDTQSSMPVRLMKRLFRVHPTIDTEAFLIRKNGAIYITPLLLALLFLEMTDIVFAVDSIPAIFAITKEPLIVYTSNIFAMMGLRSMYFMLNGVINRFAYVKYGLAGILIFIGSKMAYLYQFFDGKFPITWSLLIIALLFIGSILISIQVSRKNRPKISIEA